MIYPFKNIVFEGGGVRAIAYGGTLKVLEKKGIIDNLQKFAGTSAGALTALMLLIGYRSGEIVQTLMDFDFGSLLDDSWGITADIYRLYKKYGYHRGIYLTKFIKKLLEQKNYSPNITFTQLYEITKKELVIVTTNISKDTVRYLSYHTSPEMPVYLGIRASMAIPFLFEPVRWRDDLYIDGGISCNYPISVFDSENKTVNKETLGLKLMSESETRSLHGFINPVRIHSFFTFTHAILTHMLNIQQRKDITTIGYYERSMTVPSSNISSTDFHITKKDKLKLILDAQKIASKDLNYYDIHQKFPTIIPFSNL